MVNVGQKTKNTCSGCEICIEICPVNCIEMYTDHEGFSYPHVNNEACIRCSKCLKICPFEKKDNLSSPLFYLAAQCKDNEILNSSSSGGIFGTISHYFIEYGGIVFGASFTNNGVKHVSINKVEDCIQIMGSKYVQSKLEGTFNECKDLLENNKHVLFSGTGCQINALKYFLDKDYPNLYLIDIICHGVPSAMIFNKFKDYVEKIRHKRIIKINMRDKTEGWKSLRLKIFYDDGSSESGTQLCFLWSKLYQSNLTLRPSCFNCTFCNIKRAGDITLGDFWGINETKISNFNKNRGVSELLVNTEKGKKLLDHISSQLLIRDLTECEAKLNQPQLLAPPLKPNKRDNFYKNLNFYPFYIVSSYYCRYGILGKFLSKFKVK